MIRYLILIILLNHSVQANEFQAIKYLPEKINCSANKGIVSFPDQKIPYVIYEKNSKSLKLINCQKIQIQGLFFYTLLFSNEILEGPITQKVLTYEITIFNKKSNTIKTTRSEVVDEIELSGDLVNTNFDNSIKTVWGQSKLDNKIMIKIEINPKNEKSFSFLIKLNAQESWFENYFESNSRKNKN